MGRSIELFVNDILNHLNALLSSKVKNIAPLAEATLIWIYFTIRGPKTLQKLIMSLATTIASQRRTAFGLLCLVMDEWKTSSLEKQLKKIQDYVRKGLYDSDGDTRGIARKCWWSFSEHWPDLAEEILLSLAPTQKRMIRDKVFTTTGTSRMGSRLGSRLQSKQASRVASRRNSPGRTSPTRTGKDSRSPNNDVQRVQSTVEMSQLKQLGKTEPKKRINEWVCRTTNASPTDSRSPEPFETQSSSSQSKPGLRQTKSNFTQPSPLKTPLKTPSGPSGIRAPSQRREIPVRNSSTIGRSNSIIDRNSRGQTPINSSNSSATKSTLPISRFGTTPQTRRPMPAMTAPASRSTSPSRLMGRKKSSPSKSDGPPESIQQLIPLIKSVNWTDRRDSCIAIHLWCKSQKELTPEDLKRLVSVLTRLLSDTNTKVISGCLDILPNVCQVYAKQLGANVAPLVGNLLREKVGRASLTTGTLKVRFENALAGFVNYIPENTYANMLIKLSADTSSFKQVENKILLLKQLIAVITKISEKIGMGKLTVDNQSKIGVTCIISWSADQKSQDLRKVCDRTIQSIQQVFSEDFDKMMQGMPRQVQLTAARSLDRYQKKAYGASRVGSRVGSRQVSRQASRQASPERASRDKTMVLETRMKNLNLQNKVPVTHQNITPSPTSNSNILQEINPANSPSPSKMNHQIPMSIKNESVTPTSPIATKTRSNMVFQTLGNIKSSTEVQRCQIMRQLESQIGSDPTYWKKNYDKCIVAIDVIISLLDIETNGEGVRGVAICALRQIMKVIKVLPEKSNILQTIVDLHSDESMNVSGNAQEMLAELVEKCSLSQCANVLNSCIDEENGLAELAFGHTKLIERICVDKYDQLAEQDSDGNVVVSKVLPVHMFAPSLLQQFASSYKVLRQSASSALVRYKNLIGEESILPFMRESYIQQPYVMYKRRLFQKCLFTVSEI